MIMLMLLAAAFAGQTLAEKTGTARSPLATPPVMEGCDASDLAFMTGKQFDDALKARAIEASGAATIRSFRTGEPITQDLRPDRLSLELDQAGNIIGARCF